MIFGCSKSGYFAWKDRMRDKDGRYARKQAEEQKIMEKFREIIKKHGYTPGKRTFSTEMWRMFGINISVKRCKKIMGKMNLNPNRPLKDPYKHQATHDHECTAPENAVNQNFYQGPRTVVLTDITYLHYGPVRTPFYLCVFKDAYTKEILGHAMSSRMNVALVKEAYDRMMEKHGSELKSKERCLVHSDQGSQFLSTTFKRLLSDDEFIQSVSGRGNSQDNAPCESFFGRLKTNILSLVALCPNLDTAIRLADGYIDRYNNEFYQYNLAGLAPAEFYTYVTTGIYPLDNYYGVKGTELRSVSDLVAERRKNAEKKNEKKRIAYAKKNEERNRLKKSPIQIITRDQKLLRSEIKKRNEQISSLNRILEKTKTAVRFIPTLSKEEYASLYIPQNWQKYPELDYINDMKDMF
jgi:transposase InsO family protein